MIPALRSFRKGKSNISYGGQKSHGRSGPACERRGLFGVCYEGVENEQSSLEKMSYQHDEDVAFC